MSASAGWCAATSVALGAAYMLAAGAPRFYIFVNVAALAVGMLAAALLRRVPLRDRGFAGTLTIATGIVLLATAFLGVHVEGASRWIRIAGISLQPSLILLPLALLHFARQRNWWSSIGLILASVGLALQPDRAMAGTLAAGLGALWMSRRERPVTIAFAVAVGAFVVTMLSTDDVAPVLFVEQVMQSAFGFHVLTGLAIVTGQAIVLAPAAAGLATHARDTHVFVVFGVTWLAVIVSAIVGDYPTPLVGYGSSAILGYCLSAAVLRTPISTPRAPSSH